MKKILCTLFGLISFSSSVMANQSDLEINQSFTITTVFSEGTTTAGFYTAEGIKDCQWGIMYLELSTESGKAMFSQVLAAKSAGFKVIRIDYKKNENATCTATGLHIR
ncbi:hypothetical protein KDD30_15230 [Photobacterium sp. GJ3]|uniref:hypothetical protein n=1 Tax=Photobacterium sp. GJ3 TaxID=2829502 RepID=UPI001B8A98AA|nr:hypothetical protein [Photobacterium sp. GJ3]QUJ67370.1 hypothetical protein KDD30_15230 [Photobacterium sp. GJ3]